MFAVLINADRARAVGQFALVRCIEQDAVSAASKFNSETAENALRPPTDPGKSYTHAGSGPRKVIQMPVQFDRPSAASDPGQDHSTCGTQSFITNYPILLILFLLSESKRAASDVLPRWLSRSGCTTHYDRPAWVAVPLKESQTSARRDVPA